jgi:hypothetical protein
MNDVHVSSPFWGVALVACVQIDMCPGDGFVGSFEHGLLNGGGVTRTKQTVGSKVGTLAGNVSAIPWIAGKDANFKLGKISGQLLSRPFHLRLSVL